LMFRLPSAHILLRRLISSFVVLIVFGCKSGEVNPLLTSREEPINFSLITSDHIQDATDQKLSKKN
jgi:hypothetical protein